MVASPRLLKCAALALLSVPMASHASGYRHYGGRAVIATVEVPRSATPTNAHTSIERMLSLLVHSSLFAPGENGSVVPMLADSEVNGGPDGRSYVITLAAAARFTDGSPIRSADVVDSLERLATSRAGWMLAEIEGYRALLAGEADSLTGVKALDNRRILIRMSREFHGLTQILASPESAITKRGDRGDLFWGPVGAGAFVPGKPGRGEIATLRPSQHFIGGRPFVDELVFRRAPDQATASSWVSRRQAHAALAGTTGAAEPATVILFLNDTMDAAERGRAIGSVNRTVLTEVFLRGKAEAASGLLPPGIHRSVKPGPAHPVTRPGKAVRRRLWLPDTPSELTIVAERLAVDLLAAGILVERRTASPAEIEARAATGDYDLLLLEWRPVTLDPALAMWEWCVRPSLKLPATSVAEILEALPAQASIEDRLIGARKAEALLLKTGRVLPLYHPARGVRTSPQIRGIQRNAWGAPTWGDVWLEAQP